MSQVFRDHFSSHAASYAAFRPHYPITLGEEIAKLAPARGHVVECGCGNGQLSQVLAQYFDKVDATDASSEQIAHAPRHPRITYHLANAGALPLPDHCADAVVVAQAVHWFDLPAFYAEAARIGKPGALLALICYTGPDMDDAPGILLDQFHNELLDPFWPDERRHIDQRYRTLPFPFPEKDNAPELVMDAEWTFHQMAGYIYTWSAVRMVEKAGKEALVEQFLAELKAAWGEPQTKRTVRWPIWMRLGRL